MLFFHKQFFFCEFEACFTFRLHTKADISDLLLKKNICASWTVVLASNNLIAIVDISSLLHKKIFLRVKNIFQPLKGLAALLINPVLTKLNSLVATAPHEAIGGVIIIITSSCSHFLPAHKTIHTRPNVDIVGVGQWQLTSPLTNDGKLSAYEKLIYFFAYPNGQWFHNSRTADQPRSIFLFI